MTEIGSWKEHFTNMYKLRRFLSSHGVYLPDLDNALVVLRPTEAKIFINCIEIVVRPTSKRDWYFPEKTIQVGNTEIGVYVIPLVSCKGD